MIHDSTKRSLGVNLLSREGNSQTGQRTNCIKEEILSGWKQGTDHISLLRDSCISGRYLFLLFYSSNCPHLSPHSPPPIQETRSLAAKGGRLPLTSTLVSQGHLVLIFLLTLTLEKVHLRVRRRKMSEPLSHSNLGLQPSGHIFF